MRALIQRVRSASVTVSRAPGSDGERIEELTGSIGRGVCAFVGVTHDDDDSAAASLASKIWHLRVFDDAAGVMNRSLADITADAAPEASTPGGPDGSGATDGSGAVGVLVVSQFTLYADTRRGRRPSYLAAARPEQAEALVDRVVAELRASGAHVETGRFRTDMAVSLVNDGPVTLLLEV